MIPNHPDFIEAIHERKKVNVRFYSTPDADVVDRICAPLDYGPGAENPDGTNRYWLWDFTSVSGSKILGLAPQQILDMHMLGEMFEPNQLHPPLAPQWSVPRTWGLGPAPAENRISTTPPTNPLII